MISYDSLMYVVDVVQRDYSYLRDLENGVSENPQSFWTFIHEQKKGFIFPDWMYFNDKIIDIRQSIVESFANFFQSVYNFNYNVHLNYIIKKKVWHCFEKYTSF